MVEARERRGYCFGYARISNGNEQRNTLQTGALRVAGCKRLFEDATSGGRWDRPCASKDVRHVMERIVDAGADFLFVTENIATTTPPGGMMMQMAGAFAEFERAMTRERISSALTKARAEGRIGGRRKKLEAIHRHESAERVISGRKSGAEIARLHEVSQPAVSRITAARLVHQY